MESLRMHLGALAGAPAALFGVAAGGVGVLARRGEREHEHEAPSPRPPRRPSEHGQHEEEDDDDDDDDEADDGAAESPKEEAREEEPQQRVSPPRLAESSPRREKDAALPAAWSLPFAERRRLVLDAPVVPVPLPPPRAPARTPTRPDTPARPTTEGPAAGTPYTDAFVAKRRAYHATYGRWDKRAPAPDPPADGAGTSAASASAAGASPPTAACAAASTPASPSSSQSLSLSVSVAASSSGYLDDSDLEAESGDDAVDAAAGPGCAGVGAAGSAAARSQSKPAPTGYVDDDESEEAAEANDADSTARDAAAGGVVGVGVVGEGTPAAAEDSVDLLFAGYTERYPVIAGVFNRELYAVAHTGCPDDWTERFQRAVVAVRASAAGSRTHHQHSAHVAASFNLLSLFDDFVSAARRYGSVILSELFLADARKTIKPIDIGGVAGGLKYLCSNIVFKLSVDTFGLYGSDALAAKAAAHELRSLGAYHNVCAQGAAALLHTPLVCIVDHLGFRLLAASLLPIDKSTLVYGSQDGGRTVLDGAGCEDADALRAAVRAAGDALHIRPHIAGTRKETATRLHTCTDLEVHRGHDERFYVVDAARTFPPEALEHPTRASHLYCLLRPEFVAAHGAPLSNDAFTRFAMHDPDAGAHRADVVAASVRLRGETIPRLATELVTRSAAARRTGTFFQVASTLPDAFHAAGINLRHLGLVRRAVLALSGGGDAEDLGTALLFEAVARALKNEIRAGMRARARALRVPLLSPHTRFVVDSLNRIFVSARPASAAPSSAPAEGAAAHDDFWTAQVVPRVQREFPGALTDEEASDDFPLQDLLFRFCVFNPAASRTGAEQLAADPAPLFARLEATLRFLHPARLSGRASVRWEVAVPGCERAQVFTVSPARRLARGGAFAETPGAVVRCPAALLVAAATAATTTTAGTSSSSSSSSFSAAAAAAAAADPSADALRECTQGDWALVAWVLLLLRRPLHEFLPECVVCDGRFLILTRLLPSLGVRLAVPLSLDRYASSSLRRRLAARSDAAPYRLPFTVPDIAAIEPVVRPMNAVAHAEGVVNAHLGRLYVTVNAAEAHAYLERAVACFERAISADPTNTESLVGCAHAIRLSLDVVRDTDTKMRPELNRRVRHADAYLRRALALTPRSPAVLGEVALLRFVQGQFKDAESYFLRALGEDPNDARLLRAYAHMLANMGNHQGAQAFFGRAASVEPIAARIDSEPEIACDDLLVGSAGLSGSVSWERPA